MDSFISYLFALPLLIQIVAVFIFSTLVGSFINVVIYRLPIMLERDWQNQAREILELPVKKTAAFSLLTPRSSCRNCGNTIRFLENIPIISYLLIRGKCRNCKAKISIFYPIVELLTALLATFVFWQLNGKYQGFFAIFFVFSLIILTGIDFKTQLLPDNITIPFMWSGIILSFWHIYIPLKIAILGAVIGYLSLWIIANLFKLFFNKDGMGLGDAKLLAAIFTWIHIKYLPLLLIIACTMALIATIIQRLFNQQKIISNPLAFGPYLSLGGVITLLYGHNIMTWYINIIFN